MPSSSYPSKLHKYGSALADLAANLSLNRLEREIREDLQRRSFELRVRALVIGEVKHGKSSVINALLQRKFLPVGVTPTTSALIGIYSGPEAEQGRFLIRHDGTRHPLSEDQFLSYASGETELPGVRVELVCEEKVLPDGLEIFDTPGFNDLERLREAISRNELRRADLLIIVLDATQVLSRSETQLLREAIEAIDGLDSFRSKIRFIVNRIDMVPPNERNKVVEYLSTQMQDMLGKTIEPFVLDAKSALSMHDSPSNNPSNNPSNKENQKELERLRNFLESVAKSKSDILPARMRTSLIGYSEIISYDLSIRLHALELDRDRLANEIRAVELAFSSNNLHQDTLHQRVQKMAEQIKKDSKLRISEYQKSLMSQATEQIHRASLRHLVEILPSAIQDSFLDASRRECERLREDLEGFTREILATHGTSIREAIQNANLQMKYRGPTFYFPPPSWTIEIGSFALGLIGTAVMYFGKMTTGMVMTIASPLATMMLREKAVREARKEASEKIPEAVTQCFADMQQASDSVVDQYCADFMQYLSASGDNIGQQLKNALLKARELEESSDREAPRKATEQLQSYRNQLEVIGRALQQIPTRNQDESGEVELKSTPNTSLS